MLPAIKRITCIDCGYCMTVPADMYRYPRCPTCSQHSFECSATGGCPRCAGEDEDHAFELAEIAYDAAQEEHAIYHGMTEQEFMDAPEWRSTIDQRAFYDEPDTCEGYASNGPFSCICAFCADARTRHHLPWWRRVLRRLW
jgi:hypothetical protein